MYDIVYNIVYHIACLWLYALPRWLNRIEWMILELTSKSLYSSSAHSSQSAQPQTVQRHSCMQRKGVPMLYKWAANQVPTLYVCPVTVENYLRRVPLLPCYLKGNTVNTNPHSCRSQIPKGAAADSRPDSGTGTQGAGCLRLISGCGSIKGLFSASSL